jgi:monoamine oxidase
VRFDHGAQYVGDLQNEIMSQIRDLLGEEELVNGAALRKPYPYQVMFLNQERMCFRFDDSLFGVTGVPPQLGFWGAVQMLGLLAEMTLIERFVDIVEPWNSHPSIVALDQVTIAEWLDEKWWVGARVRDLVTISVEALLSVEPSEISPFYFLWYCACNDGFLNEINDDTGGPQQYWLRSGTDALARRYAEPVEDRIRSGVSVTAIDSSGEAVAVDLADGSRVLADRVVVATSAASAGRSIRFTPELPAARQTMLSQPMGRTLKCQVYYRSSWWHAGAGDIAYNGYVGGADYPVLWVMDNSPPDAAQRGGPFVLMTFTVGRQLDELGSAPTHEQIVDWVTKTLKTQFEDERALSTSEEFIRLESYLWNPEEEPVGGGPNTIFTPGTLSGPAGRLLSEPHDGAIYFASAETCLNPEPRSKHASWSALAEENLPAYDEERVRVPDPAPPYFSKYSDRRKSLGYMDGAMHAGDYVARQVAGDLGKSTTLPSPPKPAPHMLRPPPQPKSLGPGEVLDVVRAMGEVLAATELDDMRAHSEKHIAKGRRGQASWLRDRLSDALERAGLVASKDPIATLAAVRDFAASLHGTLEGLEDFQAADEHIAELEREVRQADEHIERLFSSRS